MTIETKALSHWMDHFYGYGSWDSPIWFVAHEEGGGDLPEEVAEKLSYFSRVFPSVNTPTLCDIRDLYQSVAFRAEGPRGESFSNLYEYRFGPHAILHGYWKNLIAFMFGYRDTAPPDLLTYQKNQFAQDDAALIRLYPLPSPHNHAWYYSWLQLPGFPFLKSRKVYEEFLYPLRIRHLLESIVERKPELVVMYGMSNITTLKDSVFEFFPAAKFQMMKAIKQQIPQHHLSDLNGTQLVITTQIPALRHNRVETGFDWWAFGGVVGGR